jgi:hypothetical protein
VCRDYLELSPPQRFGPFGPSCLSFSGGCFPRHCCLFLSKALSVITHCQKESSLSSCEWVAMQALRARALSALRLRAAPPVAAGKKAAKKGAAVGRFSPQLLHWAYLLVVCFTQACVARVTTISKQALGFLIAAFSCQDKLMGEGYHGLVVLTEQSHLGCPLMRLSYTTCNRAPVGLGIVKSVLLRVQLVCCFLEVLCGSTMLSQQGPASTFFQSRLVVQKRTLSLLVRRWVQTSTKKGATRLTNQTGDRLEKRSAQVS